MEPNQDSISLLADMCGLTSEQAVFLLRKHNNDADRAVNDFFDNGPASLEFHPPNIEQWQETDNLPTFRIDRDDTGASSIRAAASRPSSPASYGQTVDLSAAHAAADPSKVLSLREQEELNDRQMNEVIMRSLDPQENGVTATGQQFGPATGSNYSQNQWGMVHVGASSKVHYRENFEHPRPSKRRRVSGEPAFLRGPRESGYLGSMLTIYHSIPLAREALLFPAMKVHAYGYDPSWWNGSSDENIKNVSVDNPVVNSDYINLLCEVQSLMAFLDDTERAYGSVDALADLRAYKAEEAEVQESLMTDMWKRAAADFDADDDLIKVFHSCAIMEASTQIVKDFSFLDPPVEASTDIDQSIYDILDEAIWNDDVNIRLNQIYVSHCADIFTIRLRDRSKSSDEGLQLKIPAIWYSDRYLEECQDQTWEMRTRRQQIRVQVNKLMQQKQKYREMLIPHTGKSLNVQSALAAAKDAATIAVKDKTLPNGSHDEVQPLLSGPGGISQSQLRDCQADLQNILEQIERKLQLLDQRIDECSQQYRAVGQILTQNPLTAGERPHHRYFLQGVSTQPHVTYLRKRTQSRVVGESDETVCAEDPWEWWRISFSKDDSPFEEMPVLGPVTESQAAQATSDMSRKIRQPVSSADAVGYSIRRVREYEVLKAAREESNQILLVYASESALEQRGGELSPALRAFVNKDNQAFETELRVEAEQDRATWRSSEETESQIFEDVPLSANGWGPPEPLFSREMTPMSAGMGSPKREAQGDTLRSPKRPRSSDDDMPSAAVPEAEDPPPYEAYSDEGGSGQEMVQKSRGPGFHVRPASNRIGQHSEMMMQRLEEASVKENMNGGGVAIGEGAGEAIHIEHSTTPLR